MLSGAAFARAPEPTIEINIDVLQNLVPPAAATQATPAYKPSAEKTLILPKTAKPCHKPTTPKKKKVKKPKAEKTLPRPEFIEPAPAVIVPIVPQPEPTPEPIPTPIEVAPPVLPAAEKQPAEKPEHAEQTVDSIENITAPAAETTPVAEVKTATTLPLQTRILYKLQDWALAVDVWRQGVKDKLMRKSQPEPEPVAPIVTPAAPAVDAAKTVEVIKVEKPQQPVPAAKVAEEEKPIEATKPEPFVIPAEQLPAGDLSKPEDKNVVAPIANDLAPTPEVVTEKPKTETTAQSFIDKIISWKNGLRQKLNQPEPAVAPVEPIAPALPETPPVTVEPEKPVLPETPPQAEIKKQNGLMEALPSAPPIVVIPEKIKEKLPDVPPAAPSKAAAVAPQNILPDVPPVPAAMTKNTGALYVIPFAADSDEIKLEEQGYLLALVQRMKQEENLRIAVQGFAPLNNGQEYEARRLSLKRAVGVRQFLMDKGVDATRVNVQALGSATEESLKDRVDILRIN